MSSPLVVPFNFQTASFATGTTGTYTVPAGKYSLVLVTYSLCFTVAMASTATNEATSSMGGSPLNGSFQLWMKAGDTLTLAASNTTGSASSSISSNRALINATGTAGLTYQVNGNTPGLINTKQSASIFLVTNAPQTTSITITPSASFTWNAQEFNQIS